MGFKKFNIKVVLHVILLAITCVLFIWSLYQPHLFVAKFTLGFFFIAQTILLVTFIQNTNKRLYHFMELLKSQQFMERFDKLETESSYQKLNQIYNEILDLISNVKIDKEIEHQYFEHILKIIGTCIISYRSDGSVELFNNAARETLKIDKIKYISELGKKYPEFTDFLEKLKSGDNRLFKLKVKDDLLMLSVRCSLFKLKDKQIKIISFQNIRVELENEELDAWQKLISVLRHEIMNSISPISSLTGTIIRLLSEKGKARSIGQLSDEKIEKAFDSLQAIDKRNKGLLNFVESYRSITKIPRPNFKTLELSGLLEGIRLLLEDKLKENKIALQIDVNPDNIVFNADEKLISQVLINLIDNSIYALQDVRNKLIRLEAFITKRNSVVIKVIDNGPGISPEHLDKVFVPFFSTKEEGSGIGLSLSKQIVRMHQGTISLESGTDYGTVVRIEF